MLQPLHTTRSKIADRLMRPLILAAAALVLGVSLTAASASQQATTKPSGPTSRPATQPSGRVGKMATDQETIWAAQWEEFMLRMSAAPVSPRPQAHTPVQVATQTPAPSELQARAQSPAQTPAQAAPAQPQAQAEAKPQQEKQPATGQPAPFDWLTWSENALAAWNDQSAGEEHAIEEEAPTTLEPAADLVPQTELMDGMLRLTVNNSRIIKTSRPFYRVSVASPEIADVTPLAPDSLMLSTKMAGNTQLVLWDENDRAQTLLVRSEADLREINEKFDQLLPEEDIEIVDLRGRIALRGRVSNVDVAQRALEIAGAYSEEVLDFMQVAGAQQVMLEIRFAEVSRSAGKALGFNFGIVGQDGSGASNIGNVNAFGPGATAGGNVDPTNLSVAENVAPAVTLFGGGVVGDVAFEAFLSALRENNLLRVLAEPNLTLISGEEGEFLAGGEVPIPVPQGNQTLTIEYKSFGIKLKALPVVLGDGRIRVRVEPEVSDIDRSTAVTIAGISVPGFRVRQLSTEVELVSGQTFVLAGLLDSSVTANKQVTPLLGDIPVLGSLFRSTRYQRRETELVVLITPRLVSPLNPDEIPPLPGEKWKHPSEYQLFLLGEMGGEAGVRTPHQGDVGGADDAATRRDPDAEPKLEATYTFLPAEPATKR